MIDEVKSIDKRARIGIISEVVGFRGTEREGNHICIRMKDDHFGESRAWFRKDTLMKMLNNDYARKT